MYEQVHRDLAARTQYIAAHAYTVPGKAIITRELARSLRSNSAASTIAVLGGDLGWVGLLLSGYLPQSHIMLIDKSEDALAYARSICPNKRISFISEDIHHMSLLNTRFDAAIGVFVLHLLEPISSVLQELYASIRHGGILALVLVTAEQWRSTVIGSLFETLSQRFRTTEVIVEECATAGFDCIESRELVRMDEILVEDIPAVFSRHANSFYFNLSDAEIAEIQNVVRQHAEHGRVQLALPCQMMIFRKEGYDDVATR